MQIKAVSIAVTVRRVFRGGEFVRDFQGAVGAGTHEKKIALAGNNTYIRALLALELGDSIVGGRSITAQLEFGRDQSIDDPQVGDSVWVDERGDAGDAGGGRYLRHGGDEAGAHAGRPQALASSREVSGGEHRGQIPTIGFERKGW